MKSRRHFTTHEHRKTLEKTVTSRSNKKAVLFWPPHSKYNFFTYDHRITGLTGITWLYLQCEPFTHPKSRVTCMARLIDWSWMAFSAQIGYIMPLISTLQLKKVKLVRKLAMLRAGTHTISYYNKWFLNLVFVRKTLRHKRYHQNKENQTTQQNAQLNTTQ